MAIMVSRVKSAALQPTPTLSFYLSEFYFSSGPCIFAQLPEVCSIDMPAHATAAGPETVDGGYSTQASLPHRESGIGLDMHLLATYV